MYVQLILKMFSLSIFPFYLIFIKSKIQIRPIYKTLLSRSFKNMSNPLEQEIENGLVCNLQRLLSFKLRAWLPICRNHGVTSESTFQS